MIQLTDELIRNAFANTGLPEDYFLLYTETVKNTYDELQQSCPDDEDVPDDESNAVCSISLQTNL